MVEGLFEVATEFKFDIGQALLNTRTLQEGVDDLSKSADGAMTSLQYLASGLVAHLGFGSGGVLSVLSKAVQISEQFNQSALGFANNISSNIQVLAGTIHTFNERLSTSEMLMDNISQTGIKFGVDTTELARMTQLIATPLAMRGKLGVNYQNAISMSKNVMLGGEAVGMNPSVAGESLYRALSDKMPLHGQLFARLMNTPAFKGARISQQHQLINMNQDRKIDLLTKALEQLGGDAQWVAARMNRLGVQLTVLKDQIMVVLKPIGDAIVQPLKKMLQFANAYLLQHGKEIGESIGNLLGSVLNDPKELYVNIMQMKRLGHDFKKAIEWTSLYTTGKFVVSQLAKIGITFNGGFIKLMSQDLIMFAVTIIPTVAYWIGRGVRLIAAGVSEFMLVFAPLFFFFQIFSRAMAIAKLKDAEAITTLLPKMSMLIVRFKEAIANILLPLNLVIEKWGNWLSFFFETSVLLRVGLFLFEGFVDILEGLGKTMVVLMGVFAGFTNMIIGFFLDIAAMKNPFSNALGNFKEGYHDWMTEHVTGDKTVVSNNVVNIGKQEVRFDMREQMEPDRIAFAVTTQLKKLAMNPTQGRGQSLSSAFALPSTAGAR